MLFNDHINDEKLSKISSQKTTSLVLKTTLSLGLNFGTAVMNVVSSNKSPKRTQNRG